MGTIKDRNGMDLTEAEDTKKIGEGKGYPHQYSGLENSMDCIVHGVAKSLTRLNDFHFHFWSHTGENSNFSEAG